MTAGRLVLVFACPLAQELGALADRLGWPITLVDPDRGTLDADPVPYARCELRVEGARLDADCDVVVCDPDRAELSEVVAALVASPARTIAVSAGSRAEAAATLPGDPRVDLSPGLDLGGRSPAETAVALVAALIADRHGAPAGLLREP